MEKEVLRAKRRGGNDYIVKIGLVMCFAIAMLFFSIIFSLKFTVEKDAGTKCFEKMSRSEVYNLGRSVGSRSMAKKIIEIYAERNKVEPDIEFMGSGLEPCGPAFVFVDRTDNAKYAVCEDGKIYEYRKICQT